jgi:glutathione synthase/RimK-type ligase-like ATP-grasp enzyme
MLIPKVVIVKTRKGQRYADFIAKEINITGARCGITGIKNLKDYLAKNKCPQNNTLIHARAANPNFIYLTLKELEKEGYRIINPPETIKLTSDKFASCVYALKHGIPCAETIKADKDKAGQLIREKLEQWGKIIVKPITSQGQGEFCFKIDNISQAGCIQDIPTKEIVIQRFVDYDRLYRVLVIGFKAVRDAVFWDSPGNGWKCSVCLNPMIKCEKGPAKELLEFAEHIARNFNAGISFIDIFSTKEGYVLNEINTACSLAIHERISRCNISKIIAEYLLSAST